MTEGRRGGEGRREEGREERGDEREGRRGGRKGGKERRRGRERKLFYLHNHYQRQVLLNLFLSVSWAACNATAL